MPAQWLCLIDGTEYGPLTAKELRKMARRGQLTRNDFVRKTGSRKWTPASRAKGLFDGIADVPKPEPLDSSPSRENGSATRPNSEARPSQTTPDPASRATGSGSLSDHLVFATSGSVNWLYLGATLVIALAVGAATGFVLGHRQGKSDNVRGLTEAKAEAESARQRQRTLESELAAAVADRNREKDRHEAAIKQRDPAINVREAPKERVSSGEDAKARDSAITVHEAPTPREATPREARIQCKWYTASEFRDVLGQSTSLSDRAKKQRMVFLVVDITIPGHLLNTRPMTSQELQNYNADIKKYNRPGENKRPLIDEGWRYEHRLTHFKIHTLDGSTFTAEGQLVSGHVVRGDSIVTVTGGKKPESAPESANVLPVFVVKRSDLEEGNIQFQYKDEPRVTLNSTNRSKK